MNYTKILLFNALILILLLLLQIYPKFIMDLLNDSEIFYGKAYEFSKTSEINGSMYYFFTIYI